MNSVIEANADLLSEDLLAFPILFARQLARTPDNLAIVFEDRQYSYRELDQLSDQFKHAVIMQGSGHSHNVGICVDKSPEAIAAMLGILKAGAAFVPLDPEFPVDRISYMIDDAEITTIITQPNHQVNLAVQLDTQQNISWINCYQPVPNQTVLIEDHVDIQPSDLAYIMYTSGSTGKPKGVQIEHEALATYCFADIDVYQVQESDRTLQFSTINFDIAIEEIFPPLLTGSCIVIRPSVRSDSLNELSTIIDNYKVTAVHIATAYWHEWIDLMMASGDHIPETLRLMIVTGEKVSTKHYQHWKKLCKHKVLWCNAYGPTEATVSASVFIPDESFAEDNMPIGKPLKRYTAMIVDDNYNDLPFGETGQLLIGGPALARGYLNRPELNAEVFVEINKSDQTERMYKTGDLARWLENGDIEFAGRIDHQIKLGSYRIEPGEIEVVINQHEQVLESLITYDEVDSKKTLIAFVARGDHNISASDLSSFLREKLPAYMVPARYVLIKNFPKTTNGKIDRKALPDPSQSEVPRTSNFVAPRNDLEQKLSGMWQEVLQLPEVGIHDDFFALGGSSLLAVGVVSRLVTDLDLELPVRDFFANPTIASQAKHIAQMLNLATEDTAEDDSRALRERLPIVKPTFFKSDENDLFGVHYQPRQESRSHAVLMCHPLGHEYPRSFRNLQQFAIQLSNAGFNTFRFDYSGTGNSSGKSADLTSNKCIKDIQTAAAYIREQSQCDQLSIIAVRLGAPLVMKAEINDIENMILWDPVIHGSNYISLLEDFHSHAVSGLGRFRKSRKSSRIDQLYGHAMSAEKRQSFSDFSISSDQNQPAKKHFLVSSKNYLADETGCEKLLENWTNFTTDDEIYWHSNQYTESAFSSPEAYQTMMKILKGEVV